MGRLLVTLGTLLVLALGVAFVAPAFMDWNAYRPDIEQAASALLGRKISIIGDIDIALLPEPHLHAKKVAAEGDPSEAAQMTAEAVDLTLSLQSLFDGRLEASRLKLLNPFLILDLSKPLKSSSAPAKAAPIPLAAGLTSLEIQGGRISVYPDAGQPEALILTGVDGTLLAPPPGNAYRFSGRFVQNSQRFDLKFTATPHGKGVKLAGTAANLASKAVFQADGLLNTAAAPVFEGALALSAPRALTGAPFEIQAKAGGKLDREGLALSDLVLTMDPENRPQVLTGAANVAFTPAKADITLQAHSLDADALMSGTGPGVARDTSTGWSNFRSAADQMLWLYPDFGVHLSLALDQVQFRGETVEGAKFGGTRTAQKWLFEDAGATLPGETAIKLTGAFKRTGGNPELTTRVALEGKNLGRLNRWISASAANARPAPPRTFSANGLLTLSDDVTAFTDVKGDVDATPFNASLRFDKAPLPKLKISLSGDSFDLTGLENGRSGADALSGESVKAAWQAGLAQLAPVLGDDPAAIDTADIDVSAGAIKTSFIEAKNVAIQLKFDPDLLTVTKLSAETADGLALHGEGVVPLRSGGQGRFDGRLEANSQQAILKLAALAGYDGDSMAGRRAENLAPASLAINSSADGQGSASAQLSGKLGAARLDGRVQLKGSLAEWRAAGFSGQLALSAMEGNALVSLLFPKAGLSSGASNSPGAIAIRANGTSERLDMSASVKAALLQAQIDGAAAFKGQTFSFTGKAQGSSQSPEQFLPPALLALLGGEPRAGLRVETTLAYSPERIDAAKLRAELPKNVVTGHLAIGASDRLTEVDADLKADQLAPPAILSYLLAQPTDRIAAAVSGAMQAPSPDIWSNRPFALNAFQDTTAKITLAAKTIKLGETFSISNAQISATLEDGRLEVQKFEGKALGGDLTALLSLDARGAAVAATATIALSKAELSALANNGSPPILSGKGSLSLHASGQGLSPRGIISVLRGKGVIALQDGQLSKLSPARAQKSADELASAQQPPTEDAIKKKVFDALQSADLKYRHLKVPFRVRDGMLEIPRASFRSRDNKDGTVRMEAYLDLSTMQADTSWQAGVSSDRRTKWPPVKVQMAGPLRELGGRPRALSAEDLARTILVRKMEGDMTKLENLDKPPATTSAWATKQAPAPPPPPSRKRDEKKKPAAAQAGAAASGTSDFERRMRDALSKNPAHPDAQ